jgi:hypothetical protein
MPAQTKRDWQRVPNSYLWNGLHFNNLCQNVGAGTSVSASTIQAAGLFPLPFSCKIAKVAIAFTAVSGAASATMNIAYGIGSGSLLSGALIYTPIVGDDSFNGPPPGGMGAPSTACYAAQNQAVLVTPTSGTAGDITFNTTNFPNSTTGSGGIAVFGQATSTLAGIANCDVVYPTGNATGGTLLSGFCGFLRLTLNTSAATTVSGITVSLGLEPVTLTENWAAPYFTNGYPIPGIQGAF